MLCTFASGSFQKHFSGKLKTKILSLQRAKKKINFIAISKEEVLTETNSSSTAAKVSLVLVTSHLMKRICLISPVSFRVVLWTLRKRLRDENKIINQLSDVEWLPVLPILLTLEVQAVLFYSQHVWGDKRYLVSLELLQVRVGKIEIFLFVYLVTTHTWRVLDYKTIRCWATFSPIYTAKIVQNRMNRGMNDLNCQKHWWK